MIYEKTIKISKDVVDRMEYLLDQEELDFKEEDIETDTILFYKTVKFEDGCQADIKVCCGQTNAYVDAVLFSKDGQEVQVLEESFKLHGEYTFSYNKIEYNIELVAE